MCTLSERELSFVLLAALQRCRKTRSFRRRHIVIGAKGSYYHRPFTRWGDYALKEWKCDLLIFMFVRASPPQKTLHLEYSSTLKLQNIPWERRKTPDNSLYSTNVDCCLAIKPRPIWNSIHTFCSLLPPASSHATRTTVHVSHGDWFDLSLLYFLYFLIATAGALSIDGCRYPISDSWRSVNPCVRNSSTCNLSLSIICF